MSLNLNPRRRRPASTPNPSNQPSERSMEKPCMSGVEDSACPGNQRSRSTLRSLGLGETVAVATGAIFKSFGSFSTDGSSWLLAPGDTSSIAPTRELELLRLATLAPQASRRIIRKQVRLLQGARGESKQDLNEVLEQLRTCARLTFLFCQSGRAHQIW